MEPPRLSHASRKTTFRAAAWALAGLSAALVGASASQPAQPSPRR